MAKESSAIELRKKNAQDLIQELKKHREELQQIRFMKSSGTAVQKVSKIKGLRKLIARILTILREKNKIEKIGTLMKRYETKYVEEEDKNAKDKKKLVPVINEKGTIKNLKLKHLPKDLRMKKTRAIRRKLTKFESNLLTIKQLKRKLNFPLRKFAVPCQQ